MRVEVTAVIRSIIVLSLVVSICGYTHFSIVNISLKSRLLNDFYSLESTWLEEAEVLIEELDMQIMYLTTAEEHGDETLKCL